MKRGQGGRGIKIIVPTVSITKSAVLIDIHKYLGQPTELTFFGWCTGLSPSGVDAWHADDAELSSTSEGEMRPATVDML